MRGAGQRLFDNCVERGAVDEVERIDGITLHLAHLRARFVDDQAVQEHPPEGHVPHEMHAHHDHASDPEE